jgi:hypothetical protein
MQLYLIIIQPHPQTPPKQKLVPVPTNTSKSATPIAILQTDSSSHTYPQNLPLHSSSTLTIPLHQPGMATLTTTMQQQVEAYFSKLT